MIALLCFHTEDLFSSPRTVDLYFDVVLKATEWPTRDYSLKTFAKHLGFAWRDTHPSGAASIEWFDRWVTTRDASVVSVFSTITRTTIAATRVLLDGIRAVPVVNLTELATEAESRNLSVLCGKVAA